MPYVEAAAAAISQGQRVARRCCHMTEAIIVRMQRPSFSLNLEISGNNRFFAFFDALDHVDEESSAYTNYLLLAFS